MDGRSISLLLIFFAFEKLVSTGSYAAKSSVFYCCWFSLSRHQEVSSKPFGLLSFRYKVVSISLLKFVSKGPNSNRSIDKVQILGNERR